MKSLSSLTNTTPNPQTTPAASVNTVSLQQLVSRLLDSFIPVAVANNSFIINDVDTNLQLKADEQVLAFVVGNLLTNAINSSKSVCIRVEAVKTETGVQIRVRHNGASYHSTVAHSFSQVIAAARSLGGNINIYNQAHEGTIISFYLAA
jgi:C4-dicarboxylate-specific signal transduction histidine kinase